MTAEVINKNSNKPTTRNQTSSKQHYEVGNDSTRTNCEFHLIGFEEHLSFILGFVVLVCLLPLVGPVVGCAVLWDALDRGFQGRPLEGKIFQFATWFNKVTHSFNSRLVKNESDAFVPNMVLLVGILLPTLFFYCMWHTATYGFSITLCFVYHLLRIGPYFMNFAYVYTLCHKEGHSLSLFKNGPWNVITKNIFNWWIGLFFGVFPSSFAYGHSINHHRYNNGPLDVISTADKPRDNVKAFVCYLIRFFLYAINISTVYQFYKEKQYKVALKMVWGTLYFLIWAYIWLKAVGPFATALYVFYPMAENVILLACVAWCWHAFLDPSDPEDEYVGAVTIFNGPINVLNEDFHVVHHQYPGIHWENNPKTFEKHMKSGDYQSHLATCFKDTHAFELFFVIILRNYEMMTDKFVDLSKTLTREQTKELIKTRLRVCWWGPRANLNIKLEQKEIGNYEDPLHKKKAN